MLITQSENILQIRNYHMLRKYVSFICSMSLLGLFLQGCSSLIFDQSAAKTQAENSFESQINSLQSGISAQIEKKDYETNRIFTNDFPVTYRAKPKASF